jgi:cytochrome c biogenesis protein ResB
LERAQAIIYYTWWFKLLLIALALNMSCATVMTVMQKTLPSRRMRVHTQKSFYEASPLATRFGFAGTIEDVAAAFRKQGFKVQTKETPVPPGPGGSETWGRRSPTWAW